ncbi:MAG TPA: cbb3-type cytochrome c oxidase N-terminal domain-containing protein [Saprospiraceae bacterium]|nr:cbb3-type cytochrome c oxidase N-terminal domain-containing protein [Saprospiraceae bacterium]
MNFTNFIYVAAVKSADTIDQILKWSLDNVFVIMAALIAFGALMTIWKVFNKLSARQTDNYYREHGMTTPDVKPFKFAFPGLKKINDAMWKLVPIEQEADIDLGHEYDGIRELDNRLPPWWLYIFYGTILFAVVYSYLYIFTDKGQTQAQEYEYAMEVAADEKRAFLSQQANAIDENSVVALTDEVALREGKAIFTSTCAACHGQAGEGGVGPNFTDKYWIHGGSIKNIFTTVKYGVPEKGMISWQSQLSPAAMQKVSSYILTLVGTNPPNQKEKQGILYEPEETQAKL